jgi:hypothetical protein
LKFHERFNIEIDTRDAQDRFVNRVKNRIIDALDLDPYEKNRIGRHLANGLGKRYSHSFWELYVPSDFSGVLQALELIYEILHPKSYETEKASDKFVYFNNEINAILVESEIDLGIKWEKGQFIRSGVQLLDDAIVNDPLRWLKKRGYETVYQPFEKGLLHFIRSASHPEFFPDVITDMYESLEALVKIITAHDSKDLSANQEMFISMLKVSEEYRKILKEYIQYANSFRHAAGKDNPKPALTVYEVESFIYLTGIFIRLTMQTH